MASSTSNIAVGSPVWVEDPQLAWIEAEVVKVSGNNVTLCTKKGKTITTLVSRVHPRDTDAQPGGVDDMTKLAYLHEPGVLSNLASRYGLDEIYTYTGSILIAVNPFAKLPHLYNTHMMEQYRGAPFGELSPHVFAVADSAYRTMINEKICQSILVSGESGAGKTETTKLIMQYLAYMGGRAATDGRTVEQQVLESNPLLEAFGNAKTVRNDNSSRFGKFVDIQFDKNGRISGAAIRTYLLERSRVVQISDPERNYHCFYQLCASEDAEKYKLHDPKQFHYLNQSKCFELTGISNSREYANTRRAMDIVGISPAEQESIFRVVAAILHLGNINFAPGKDSDCSIVKDQKSRFHLQTAAELLKCDAKGLQDALCTRVIVTRDESITVSLNPASAVVNRDTLAKTIYSRLFDWLVEKINKSIGQDEDSKTVIGVLDIYGFETFKSNSFEQFCINFANEKLQQHFNQHVFKMEQEEYTKEAINWSYIEFIDNQDVLDLIEKKPVGIIALLDEACMFPKSTHETFATKLVQAFRNHKRFSQPRLAQTDFTIAHYAGEVTYQTDYFLDKNKDYVVAEHQAILGSSACEFVSGLFPAASEDFLKSSYKFSSIGTGFKHQLQQLMETLSTTQPHYIRCVKPNSFNKPCMFENANVLQQLRCGGVLEAVRISCAGYPTRQSFDQFLDRFGFLSPEFLDGRFDERTATEKFLQKLKLDSYQIGKTKVFLRAGQMAELDAMRTERLNSSAKLIQRKFRSYYAQKEFISLRKAATTMQAYWRGRLARKQYDALRRESAAIVLQKYVRGLQCRREFRDARASAVRIQSCFRGMSARRRYRSQRKTKAATCIQSHWRAYKSRRNFIHLRKAATAVQCQWKGRMARRELKRLRVAARETGALQAAKTKLEKRCEELTWRLQLEKRMRVDAEESKELEVSKLQALVQDLQRRVESVNALLTNERVQHRKAIDSAVSAAKQSLSVQATQDSKIQQLTAENTRLQALVHNLQSRTNDAENQLAVNRRQSQEIIRKLETKVEQLQESLQRSEERFSNLESENQVLRQQALALSPTNSASNRFKTPIFQRIPDSYYLANGDFRTPTDMLSPDSQNRQKQLLDRQQENQKALLQVVTQDVGFSQDRPVAAFIIFKSLLHWRSFEAERTNVFDQIIQTISSAVEAQENNDILAYWLSNTAMLLFLLQRTLKASSSGLGSQRRRTSATLFGRMTQGFRSPSSVSTPQSNGPYSGSSESGRQIEAKYPALLFKQQLTAYVEKIYGVLRDNLKKEIMPLLGMCIQAPKTARTSFGRPGKFSPGSSLTGQPQQQPQPLSHWHAIVTSLTNLLNTLKGNYVPAFLTRKLFKQIFSFINVQLFNSLLLRRECCSFSNGEFVKAGLAELEHWICGASEEFAGSSWDELKYIRQAVGFLVIHQKPKKSLDEIMNDLCPVLSVQQLYRISTMYWDDKYGTQSVSPEVIASMRTLMTEDTNHPGGNSFLLDDDSSIPFSVDDISKSMREVDLSDMDFPPMLRENPVFHFLQPQAD